MTADVVATGQGTASAGSQWTAEVEITPRLAANLIREQFPDLGARQVTVLATGWDNTAFVLDGQWLFRFPRREIAVPGVRREIAVLPRLAAVLPIPDPQFVGQPSSRYPWPFFGARLLPGRELADSGLPDSERAGAAASIGHLLRLLHDPGLAAPRQGVAGVTEPGGTLPASPAVPASGPLVVSHGDLHVRHLLVDGDGSATGVIDWGDLCLADPAADLSIAYFGFAGQARADLLSAYGRPVGAERELAARACAISLAASLAEYAVDDGRAALLRECVAGLKRAAAA